MLRQQETVVRRQDQASVLPHVVGVEIVEQTSEVGVTHCHKGRVVGANLSNLGFVFLDGCVFRPVKDGALIIGAIGVLVFFGRMERLVRIKTFQMQHPVVGIAIAVKKLESLGEAPRAGKLRLVDDLLTIDLVLQPLGFGGHVIVLVRIHRLEAVERRLNHCHPGIILLAANKLPGLVAAVIG